MANNEKNSARWRIIDAQFELSAPSVTACPPADHPEIAVMGRSNVGKSSLLNTFTGRQGLARVSRTPGRTQLLNFFLLKVRHPTLEDRHFRWVDLPGYGYAAAPKQVQTSFAPMIEGYLQKRTNLCALLLLVDSRKGVCEDDHRALMFINHTCKVPVVLVATKIDKLTKSEQGLLSIQISEQLTIRKPDIVLTSAQSGLGLAAQASKNSLLLHILERCFPSAGQA